MNFVAKVECPLFLHNPPTIQDWINVRDVLNPAIKRLGGTHTEEDVLSMILAKRLQLWTIRQSALITELVTYPRFTELSVFAAGGKKSDLMESKSYLEKHAKDIGCYRVKIEGRLGWKKVYESDPGYKFQSLTLTKTL